MMKIQIQPVTAEDLLIELDNTITILNQLRIDLKNYGVLKENGWNVFNIMHQELERIMCSVITDKQ